jgi:LDH2 family malate/lactate/ureidoglycolate dehydrogenase
MAARRSGPQEAVRRQIVAILRAWGVAAPHADAAGELLTYADLRGIEATASR